MSARKRQQTVNVERLRREIPIVPNPVTVPYVPYGTKLVHPMPRLRASTEDVLEAAIKEEE